jgi:hypothetical protein
MRIQHPTIYLIRHFSNSLATPFCRDEPAKLSALAISGVNHLQQISYAAEAAYAVDHEGSVYYQPRTPSSSP